MSCLKGCRIVHGANGTTDIQSELRPCGNRTMKPHELTILGHRHTQKSARSIMTFSRIYMQDLHTLSRDKTAIKNPYRSHPARVLVGLVGLEPMSAVRNRATAALPLAVTLCSLGLCLAFASGECPTGATLCYGPSTIVPVTGSDPVESHHEETTPKTGWLLRGGISRARTYDLHDVNVAL